MISCDARLDMQRGVPAPLLNPSAEGRRDILDGRTIPSSALWSATVTEAEPVELDDETSGYLSIVSPYGRLSCGGRYQGGAVESCPLSDQRRTTDPLQVAQRHPPLPWTEWITRPVHLPSLAEAGLAYDTQWYSRPAQAGIQERVAQYVDGPPSPGKACHANTRCISAADGEHPLCDLQGGVLDVLEVEVRWGGPAPMCITAVLLDGRVPIAAEYVGRVSNAQRWFLAESRYCVMGHVLYDHDSTGGYATVTVHLSELPTEVTAIYFLATGGDFHLMDSLVCRVASRETLFTEKLQCQYLLDLTEDCARSRAKSLALCRLIRRKHSWTFCGVALEGVLESTYDDMLPCIYADSTVERLPPAGLHRKVQRGVLPEDLVAIGELAFAGAVTPQLVADTLNAHASEPGGKLLSVPQYFDVVDQLSWVSGAPAQPREVLQRQTELQLRELGLSRGRCLDLRSVLQLISRSSLGETLRGKATRQRAP